MRELSDIERMVDDFERNATERAAKFEQMRQQVEQISITESAASGAVSVTVGNNGIPTDVRMTEAVRGMSPGEIAGAVMSAMRRAQGKYPERLQQITAATVGDDAAGRHIVDTAQDQFPPPPEPEEQPSAPPGQAPEMRIDQREPDEEPPPPAKPPLAGGPARPVPPRPAPKQRPPGGTPKRRPPSDDDDGGFNDEGSIFDK